MINAIFSSVYFGNIQYFSNIVATKEPIIDIYENYCKQSYRNRCDIVGANGKLSLTVPTVKKHNLKTAMCEIEIDYATAWQKQHLKSIVSAYKNSPYFDYYFDLIEPLFNKQNKYLIDLNNSTLDITSKIIGIDNRTQQSDAYITKGETADFRDLISPKNKEVDNQFRNIEYYQVFSEKMDFNPNMSILDLIFCEGTNAKDILENSIVNID